MFRSGLADSIIGIESQIVTTREGGYHKAPFAEICEVLASVVLNVGVRFKSWDDEQLQVVGAPLN